MAMSAQERAWAEMTAAVVDAAGNAVADQLEAAVAKGASPAELVVMLSHALVGVLVAEREVDAMLSSLVTPDGILTIYVEAQRRADSVVLVDRDDPRAAEAPNAPKPDEDDTVR